ncbi:MAG TPA: class I SAM-dependent methyltransferase [Gammaproteobacteria bacterium]
MPTVAEHYNRVLADVYSWMYGGWDAQLARYSEFFAARGIAPRASKRAIDLGAGCGFQAIPLARLGFDVKAIDLDRKLLAELEAHVGDENVETICADLRDFRRHVPQSAELIVCMVDTLLHLDTQDSVTGLAADVFAALDPGGTFIATFRDFTVETTELDRFIPVRSDERTVFTCFLEFEPATVKVHDLVYRHVDGRWSFAKSFYRKLRLPTDWVVMTLRGAGFGHVETGLDRGLVVATAKK